MLVLGVRSILFANFVLVFSPLFSTPIRMAADQSSDGSTECDQTRAVLLIQQQVEETQKIEDRDARIRTLLKIAELLWPYRETNSRDIFARAYELAEETYREARRGAIPDARGARVVYEDERFIVAEAISLRDAAWAGRLVQRISEQTRSDASQTRAPATTQLGLTDSVISLAITMLKNDKQRSSELVRSTFGSPATGALSEYLFALAAVDQAAADRFYAEALSAYSGAPLLEFFYLSPYPFALNRVIGPSSGQNVFSLPQAFQPNGPAQRLFVESLLGRAEKLIQLGPASSETGGVQPDAGPLFLGLSELETAVAKNQPGFLQRVQEAKLAMRSLLPPGAQINALEGGRQTSQTPEDAFEARIDRASHQADPKRRDQELALAAISAATSVALDRVVGAVDKINDKNLRPQLLDYVYFKRSQRSTEEGHLDDARQFASKVQPLDMRAYLLYEMAAKALKGKGDRTRAAESLSEVVALAIKAENTTQKARALLGAAQVYGSFDPIMAFDVMRTAVKAVNAQSGGDFNATSFIQRIAGETFSYNAVYRVEGFSLENVFGTIAAHDLTGALLLADKLEDTSLRAMAIIGLAGRCLRESAEARGSKKSPDRRQVAGGDKAKPADKHPPR
ncbi:MAG: hypothetical protein DMF61_06610 [Blastocatellia bacterium AA13]|nr:MAG: hypothetical protein DMF61_06610 [Blastocatellia bacterium AA13]